MSQQLNYTQIAGDKLSTCDYNYVKYSTANFKYNIACIITNATSASDAFCFSLPSNSIPTDGGCEYILGASWLSPSSKKRQETADTRCQWNCQQVFSNASQASSAQNSLATIAATVSSNMASVPASFSSADSPSGVASDSSAGSATATNTFINNISSNSSATSLYPNVVPTCLVAFFIIMLMTFKRTH